MKKSVFIYGLSTALNRGGTLLYLPFLASILSLSEFGIYSLAQTLIQLLWPIFVYNGPIAVMREGPNDLNLGFKILNNFILWSLPLSILSFAVSYTVWPPWVYIIVLSAWFEGLHQLALAWFRIKEDGVKYLTFSTLKSLGLLGVYLYVLNFDDRLNVLLAGQAIYYLVIFVIFYIFFILKNRFQDLTFHSLKPYLPYCLFLLPHIASQWVMSSADRFIIKDIMDDKAVGIYSIAYTVSMCLMLLNSGISIALPQFVVKDYSKWLKTQMRQKAFMFYFFGASLIHLLVSLILEVDHRWFGILPTNQSYFPLLVMTISAGLYCLGFYYFFVNYIFYHRKTTVISYQTIIAAIINVILTYILVPIYGVTGAAIGTFFTYVIYLILIMYSSIKLEPNLKIQKFQELKFLILGWLIYLLIGLTQWYFW